MSAKKITGGIPIKKALAGKAPTAEKAPAAGKVLAAEKKAPTEKNPAEKASAAEKKIPAAEKKAPVKAAEVLPDLEQLILEIVTNADQPLETDEIRILIKQKHTLVVKKSDINKLLHKSGGPYEKMTEPGQTAPKWRIREVIDTTPTITVIDLGIGDDVPVPAMQITILPGCRKPEDAIRSLYKHLNEIFYANHSYFHVEFSSSAMGELAASLTDEADPPIATGPAT